MVPVTSTDWSSLEDERRDQRVDLDRPGTIRFDDGRVAEATVLDLSRDGCRIMTDQPLSANQRILIGLAHVGRTRARVVWHGPAGYGCAFEQALPAGVVTAALATSNLVRLPFAEPEQPTPDVTSKLPPAMRVGVVAGAAIVSWLPILALARLLGH